MLDDQQKDDELDQEVGAPTDGAQRISDFLPVEGGHLSPPETQSDDALATAAEPEPQEALNFVEELGDPAREIQRLTEKLQQTEDRVIRTMADFENYRRRAMKDRQELLLYAAERPLNEILPILDNLERAVAHAGDGRAESILEGVQMTLNLFRQTLERMEVKAIGQVGEPFDPNCHEAMQKLPSAEIAANAILQVFQPGYRLRDRLIRPAKVIVSSGVPEATDES